MLSTPSPTRPDVPPFPSFADGPPPPERGRAVALASVVLLLGLAALLAGLGPCLTAHTSAGALTVSGYALPQGMTVVAAAVFAGLIAGLSTLPRLARVRGATPVLHAIATAAAATGVLLAIFLLIVVGNVATPADLIGGAADESEEVVIGLGWGGITILALAALQAVVAFAALAYDIGLAQARRAPEPPYEPFLPPEPTPPADDAPTTTVPTVSPPATTVIATGAPSAKAETIPIPTNAAPAETAPTSTESEPTGTETTPTKTGPKAAGT